MVFKAGGTLPNDMMALSIRGPWWWFILHGQPVKDVENRDWPEHYARQQLAKVRVGGHFLIHASGGMTMKECHEGILFARSAGVTQWPSFEWFDKFRGGIVGQVKFAGAYRSFGSPWFTGPLALALEEPYPLPFRKCRGMQGFFEPVYDALTDPTERTDLCPEERD